MEMCPYCGEEVPADSAKCWKCGTELAAGGSEKSGGAASEELAVPEDEDEGGGGAKEMIPCPHCESPVSKKATRCRECGRAVREVTANHAATAWRMGTWLIVAGVGLAAAISVGVYSRRRHYAAQVRTITKIEYADLERRLQPLVAGSTERKREVWQRDIEGKFVKWTGTVVTADPDTGHVTVSQTKGGTKADVDVELREDGRDDLRDLKPNQPIGYSARLVDFGKDGMAFTLNEGLLEK